MIDLNAARRTFLSRSALGLGSVALASLFPPKKVVAKTPAPGYAGLEDLPHFAPRAKRVIFLCMSATAYPFSSIWTERSADQ